jgi:lambda repressor-like predicted transcriptional regulator
MTTDPTTTDIPKNPAIRRAWICYQLRIRGLSLRGLARREGVSQQAMSAAALGGGYCALQEVLAGALGVRPHDLFPELYDATGARLGITRSPQRSKRAAGGNVQSGEAA